MREYKFRQWTTGWASGKNRMIYLDEMSDDDFSVLQQGKLMQFTGLKDKNSNEIYEGDVVKYTSRVREEVINAVMVYDSKQGRYKYSPISLYKANAGNGVWTGFEHHIAKSIEVLGNIYENPELLNEGE